MSTHIVVEALALVTWWAVLRLVRAITGATTSGRVRSPRVVGAAMRREQGWVRLGVRLTDRESLRVPAHVEPPARAGPGA